MQRAITRCGASSDSTARGMCKFCRRVLMLIMVAVKAGLTLNLTSYFFYSGAIYAAAGIVGLVSYDPIQRFLCNIPSRTQDCGFCADHLLMCDKDACWRYAVNLTYIKVMGPMQQYQQYRDELHRAAADTHCNDLVGVSASPVEMLLNAKELRDSTGGEQPSDACLVIHCEVLRHALMESVDTHLTSSHPPCTNKHRVKPEPEAADCPCNSLDITMAQAQAIRTLCGAQAEGLRRAVFERILLTKDQCYQASLRHVRGDDAYMFMYEIMVRDPECAVLVQSSESVHRWFEIYFTMQATVLSYSLKVECITVMCYAFDSTLRDGEHCNWANNSNLGRLDSELVESIVDTCANTALPGRDLDPAYLCRVSDLPQCGGPTNSVRLLQPRRCAADTKAQPPSAASAALPEPPELPELPHSTGASTTGGRVTTVVERIMPASLAGDAAPTALLGRPRLLQEGDGAPAPAPPTSSSNIDEDDREDWVTSGWSDCTCLQQCMRGVRTRSVSCPTGVICKSVTPPPAEPCRCWHCADCFVLLPSRVFFGVLWAKAGLSWILWLAFWRVSKLDEDDLNDMGWCLKGLGIICRCIPALDRLLVYVAGGFLVVFIIYALIPPEGGVMPDCKGSVHLKDMVVITLVCWFGQLALGIYMKKHSPVPPWLYNPLQEGVMKLILSPLRGIGP